MIQVSDEMADLAGLGLKLIWLHSFFQCGDSCLCGDRETPTVRDVYKTGH